MYMKHSSIDSKNESIIFKSIAKRFLKFVITRIFENSKKLNQKWPYQPRMSRLIIIKKKKKNEHNNWN